MELKVDWTIGFDEKFTFYIDKNTLVYISGQYVKFYNEERGYMYMPLPSYAATKLAVHPLENVFLLAETEKLNPSIFIYDYPSFENIGIIQNFTKLEILKCSFSNSDYLGVITGIPDFTFSLWNFKTQDQLCTKELDLKNITDFSICPVNWKNVVIINDHRIYICTIENCGSLYLIKDTYVKLPSTDTISGVISNAIFQDSRVTANKSDSKMVEYEFDLPPTSKAGVSSQFLREFLESQDEELRCICVSHVWSGTGDIYFGTKDGQLIKLDIDNMVFKMIFNSSNIDSGILRMGSPIFKKHDINLTNNMKTMCFAKEGIYLGGDDGILRIAKQIDNEITDNISEIHQIQGPISGLIFNYTYTHLAVVSSHGIIDILSANENVEPPKSLFNMNYGPFVGMGLIPGGKYIATVRNNGTVQIWNLENQALISSFYLQTTASSMDVCLLWNILVVGLENGFVMILDISKVESPRLIHKVKFHNGPVSKIRFGGRGKIIVTAGNDGIVVIASGRVSEKFNVLGITTFEGTLIDLSVFQNPTSDEVAQIAVSSQIQLDALGANRLVYFEISPSILNDPSSFYENINGTFDEEHIKKTCLNFDNPCFGCVLGIQPPEEKSPVLYAVDLESRCLCKYQLPSSLPKNIVNRASRLFPVKVYFEMIHNDPNTCIRSSINNRFIMTYGAQGVIQIIDLKDERNRTKVSAHQMNCGGIMDAIFNFDSNSIFSCSKDCTFSCHKLLMPQSLIHSNKQDFLNFLAKSEGQVSSQIMSLEALATIDFKQPNGLTSPDHNQLFDKDCKTWSEKRVIENQEEEDDQYRDMKIFVKDEIKSIQKTIEKMLLENDNLSDLEKIDRQEFELDIEMKKKIHSDIENEIKKVVDEIENNNLAKQYILDVIKKECWDQMSVKGRSLIAFNSNIEVTNFPLKDQQKSTLAQIDMVVKRRMIEIEESNDRKNYSEHLQKNALVTEDTEENEDEENKDSSNPIPHVDKIAPNTKYLYPQMELETRDQKIYQIILLKDIIYQMKVQFNKEFTDVFMKKEQEITRIKEKNVRICKILNDIDMANLIQPDPELSSLEKPEKLLVVEDHEIKVDRFLTEEQKKKLEDDKLAEEERRRREKLDNWRERGLEDMMGGVLEVKREDELKKDIPKPYFVIAGKAQEEWTDDEKKIFDEYEKKVKELNDEREKYKKQLEAEYKKLSSIIDDAKSTFDESLLNLFNRELSVQMSINQEEVKILRLQWSLLIDEELTARHNEILELKIGNSDEIKAVKQVVSEAKVIIEESQEAYDTLVAEEKLMDKAFRREFIDIHGSMFDFISKLYKRRPRNRLLGAQMVPSSQMPNYSKHNPYLSRPASTKQKQFQQEILKNAIQDLDKQDATDSVDYALYERLCRSRRKRIMKEFEIKQMAFEIADLQSFYQKRLEEEKSLENNELHLNNLSETLENYLYQFHVNKELQIVVKNGQVEVDAIPGFIHDFTESVFLHRSTIEDLNKEIKELGFNKVKHMTKAKDSKKKFIHLEWELRRMLMEYEDLIRKMREIQCFKITKEIQRYLAASDYDGLINAEIQKMEQTINHMKTHQTKNIDQKKNRLKYINNNKLIKIKNENHNINLQLTELNVQVNERKHINAGFPSDNVGHRNVEMRYQKILQRQNLVDLAKTQAKEVAILRAEVERLRMRTFPALIQHHGQ